jgi:hypothetical protein
MFPEKQHTDDECNELLIKIFHGYHDFLKTQIPDGWRKSDYINFFHPTAEQQWNEHKSMNETWNRISKDKEEKEEKPLTEFHQDLSDLNEEKEPIMLLGYCLWDIFSENHSVIDQDGVEYDLGSFRGCAGTIADFINDIYKQKGEPSNLDYMDFYMGTIGRRNRGDLQPVYEYIFSVLKQEGLDWHYFFPRLGIFNFRQETQPSPEDYSPEKAMAEELKNKEIEDLKKKFDDDFKASYEEAKYKKPPATVIAYRKIYGDLPEGHPQKGM